MNDSKVRDGSRIQGRPGIDFATILAGATTVHAQQTPAQQPATKQPPAQQPPAQEPSAQPQPAKPQSGAQEASPEEINPVHKVKVKDYKNWVFNVGGGASLTNGNTAKFVRGGGCVVDGWRRPQFSKYFGLRVDFQCDNLPLRTRPCKVRKRPAATSQVYSLHLDPIINIPVTKVWGGYILGGGSFFSSFGQTRIFDRHSGIGLQRLLPLVGTCRTGAFPSMGAFFKSSQNEFGGELRRWRHPQDKHEDAKSTPSSATFTASAVASPPTCAPSRLACAGDILFGGDVRGQHDFSRCGRNTKTGATVEERPFRAA